MVWVNGRYIGEHDNAYTSFSMDVTKALVSPNPGQKNSFLIRVNNSWGHSDRLPWVKQPDWHNYGEISRSVSLNLQPKISIKDFTFKPSLYLIAKTRPEIKKKHGTTKRPHAWSIPYILECNTKTHIIVKPRITFISL